MDFQVPQNLDVQETIVAGLSFKQIIFLGGAGGLFISLFMFIGVIPAVIIGGPVFVLAGLLSFYQHNNRPFSYLLKSIIIFFVNKKIYIWKKEEKEYRKRSVVEDSTKPQQTKANELKTNKIGDLSTSLNFEDETI